MGLLQTLPAEVKKPDPPPPPPPPPPVLAKKPPAEKKQIVDRMTPDQVKTYKTDVDKLPKSEQQDVANSLAKDLDANQLAKMRPAFGTSDSGKNTVDQAVDNFASAQVKADYPKAVIANDPKIHDTLTKIGFSQQDIDNASAKTLTSLTKAAEHVEQKQYGEALSELGQLAKDGQQALAEKAFAGVARQIENLPPVARDILTNGPAVTQLINAAPGVLDKILKGDVAGAIGAVGTNKPLTDAVIDAALQNPDSDFSKAVKNLGLDAAKLKESVAAAPALISAAQHAAKGEWAEAGKALADAAEKTPELAAEGIKRIAEHLPEPAKSIVSDENVAAKLAAAGPDVMRALVEGKPLEALKGLGASNDPKSKDLRDAVIDAAMKDPSSAFSKQVDKLGLTGADLKKLGDGIPDAMKAIEHADKGEWKEAALSLIDASTHAPEVAAKGIEKFASVLPEPAKSIVGNPEVAKHLADAGPEALKALVNGDASGALQHLAQNKDLRDAVIDAAMADKNSDFSKNVDKLGLTAADLKSASEGLPGVLKAVDLAANAKTPEDWKNVGLALADAAGKAHDVVAKGIQGLAGKLPDGIAKTILGNADVAKQLASASPEVIKSILNGDPGAALGAIGNNPTLRDAVIDAAVTDPQVKQVLDKYSITATDLKQASNAVGPLFNAIQHVAKGEINEALAEFQKVGDTAPQLLPKVAQAIYGALPDTVQKKLGEIGFDAKHIGEVAKALPALVKAGEALTKQPEPDFKTAIREILNAGEAAPTIGKQAIQKLGEQIPAGKLDLVKKLLADDKVAGGLASDTKLHDAIDKLLDGKTLEGASELLHNDAMRDAVVNVVAGDPEVVKALDAVGLTPEDLKQASSAMPHLLDAGIALSKKDWSGALDAIGQVQEKAPDLLGKVAGKIYEELPKAIKDKFGELQITKDDLVQGAAALPHLVNAIRLLGDPNDPKVLPALQELAKAVDAAPGLVTKAVNAIGEKLPDTPQTHLLRSILTSKDLINTLASDDALHASFKQLLEGDVSGALKSIGNNPVFMGALSKVLVEDKAFMARLAPLGIKDAAQLAELGPSLANLVDLADAFQSNDVGKIVQSFATFAKDLPDGPKQVIIDSIVDKFKLKPEMKQLLSGVLEAASTPEVAQAIGEAVKQFASGNPGEFVKALANAGKIIAEKTPDLAVTFLNALSKMPGSVGKFFSDPRLNEGIVKSGALESFFDAVTKVAEGNIGDAIGSLGDAIGKLITFGDKAQIGPFDPLGMFGPSFGPYDLPFGKDSLEMIGRLVTQFVEAMPDKVKNFLKEKAGEAVASTGLKSIPVIGPVIGVVDAGSDLISSISNHESGMTIALNAADLALNAASFFPPAQALLTPLKTLLGVAKGVNATVELVDGMEDFGQQFTGM